MTPQLIARFIPGQKKPEYLVPRKDLEGYVINRFGSDEIWGPFETMEQAEAWNKANPQR